MGSQVEVKRAIWCSATYLSPLGQKTEALGIRVKNLVKNYRMSGANVCAIACSTKREGRDPLRTFSTTHDA